MKTLLVTGAAGTVGHYVASRAESAGYRVIASDRTAQGIPMPVRGEVRPADLRVISSIDQLVHGVDFVIHTAAQMQARSEPGELSHTNTDAVVALYQAAQRAGVKRFVHLSTGTLYRSAGRPLDEGGELEPKGPYTMTKHGAEVFLRSQTGRDALPWTILRPAPLYGRRGRHFAAYLMFVGPVLRLWLPVLPRFEGGPTHTMAHADDVAGAALHVLEREDAEFEVFNVSDCDELELGERLSTTFDAYGLRTVPILRTPDIVLSLISKVFQQPAAYDGSDAAAIALWRLVMIRHGLKSALRPRLDPEWLNLLTNDLVIDSSKLRRLGWTPRFDRFADGFREVLRWYQAEGWVPRY